MPVGHCWPIEGLTITDIEQSIQLATSSRATVCAPFVTLLHEAAPTFQAWLTAVQANPSDFQVEARARTIQRRRRKVPSIFAELGPGYVSRAYRMDESAFWTLHQKLGPSLRQNRVGPPFFEETHKRCC
jgi:hypothetical protein